jgi:predicted glycoside hydrolase/deacetylase ChbG (UPF0249 family)
MKVIINADDLGMSEKVNEATFDLLSKHIVTSATILANGPCVKSAIEGSKRFPACSFGVHLNLTEFRPLSRHEGLKGLLGDDGQFNGMLERDSRRIRKTRKLLSAMADEWSSQIDLLSHAGVQISHLDSHQHVHTIPFVFPVLKFIQHKYGIRKVRIARNIYQGEKRPSVFKLWTKNLYNCSLRNFYATRTTCVFADFPTFYERVIVEGKRWPSLEVMVHPGSSEDDRFLGSNWSEKGEIRLITYNEL